MTQQIRFNCMHFMPYVHLPENHKDYQIALGQLLQQVLRPREGHELYQRYLEELVLADQLGFDAIVVNEHHNTVYSMMATPNLIAAALVPQTKNAKICVWGTPPNLMLPNRLAEEYAILDVMSNGRLEVAFPLGTGMEYWANPVNPATARDKFRESLKIILQAWTAGRPDHPLRQASTPIAFSIRGRGRIQRPHPPCYIVGTGSPETIEIAAELGFGYASVFVTQQRALELNENLRQRAAHFGHTHPARAVSAPDFHLRGGDRGAGASRNTCRTSRRFFEDYAAHHAAIPRAARLPVGRSAQDPRRRAPTSCMAGSTSTPSASRSSSRSARRKGRQPDRRLGGVDGDQPHQQRHARRRHAALEDGEEPDAVRRGGDPAPAQAHATQRVAAEWPSRGRAMGKFKRENYTVDGVKTVVHSAGHGEPLVFFHGAGTVDGFDFAGAVDRQVPRHRALSSGLRRIRRRSDLHRPARLRHALPRAVRRRSARHAVNLVGLSLGGYLAAKFACEHGHRVKKLVLIAPAGVIDPKHPMLDVIAMPGEQIPGAAGVEFRGAQEAAAGKARSRLHR